MIVLNCADDMKTDQGKRKQRTAGSAQAERPPCGTRAYIAECRGIVRRFKRSFLPPFELLNRIVTKNPADR